VLILIFLVDAPVSESANNAFATPDGRSIDFIDWNNAFVQFLTAPAGYTQATGTLFFQEFNKVFFAMNFGIHVGPAYLRDPFTYNMNKLLYIRATQTATGDTAEYGLYSERFEYHGGTGYTTSMGAVNTAQDVNMGYLIRPGSGLWMGQIMQDIDRVQAIVTGVLDAAAPIIPAGVVQNQSTIPYIFRGSIDPNFVPIDCGLQDQMSRVLFSAPAAWLGTQTANTVFYLCTPNGNTNNNVLSNFNIDHIIPDSATPDPVVCTALWDNTPSPPGQTAIWACDTGGEFYRMEWTGVTWTNSSPTPFLFGGVFSGVLYKLTFGIRSGTGNEFMIVMSHAPGSQFFNATNVTFWELTGANRNDPADWTSINIIDTNSTFSTLCDIWDSEQPYVNGYPVLQGLSYYRGDLWQFEWDGVSAWTATIVQTAVLQTQENVGSFRMDNINTADGTVDSRYLLVAGRQGFNSQNHQIVQYLYPQLNITGEGVQTIVHKQKVGRSPSNQFDTTNLYY